jgi:hypothetical protein
MAMAMLLALETQLRIGGAGPGEAILLIVLPAMLLSALWRGAAVVRGGALALLAFWGILAAALCLGVVTAMALTVPVDASLVLHDVVAYGLLSLFCLAFSTLPRRNESLRRTQWLIATIGASMSALQLANANGLFSLPNVDPWYWDRMRGWSENPNQFALLSLLIGFCALALLDKSDTNLQKATAALCAAVALGVGLNSKSNAYSMVMAAGLALFLVLKLARAGLRAERRGIPALGVLLMLASLSGLLVTLVSARLDLREELKSFASDFGRKGDDESADAALRLELWRQAVASGWRSDGFGLGPGPHLAIPPSLVAARKSEDEPKNLSHPKVGLASNFEAHNTVLELLVQGGVLAVAAFLWLLPTAVRRAWRAGFDGVIALLFATIAFGSFHVVFRHPLVWFCFCLGGLAERTGARSGIARARTPPSHPLTVDRGAPA